MNLQEISLLLLQSNTSQIISLIFAVICCFFGYKLFKFLIKFYGFIFFSIIGVIIAGNFEQIGTMLWYIIVLGSGILGIFLSYKFYKLSIFIAVAFQAYMFLIAVVPVSLICVILSGIAGSLALFFIKPVVSITTATSSGYIIGASLSLLVPFLAPFEMIIFILFAVLGSLKQLFK